ncbi:MAG: biotin transporter BioY [Fastidiosipilaceae bacterium]|jgi:biotin transport system substrate-specific component
MKDRRTGFGQTFSTRNMVLIAIFAAILAVLSQLSIPLPTGVPATLQTLAVALLGFVLGGWSSAASVILYIFLGAIGLPVFAGFKGGFAALFGPTGGFIFGFIPLALLCGFATQITGKIAAPARFALPALGLLICHAAGVTQYALISGNSWWISALAVSIPFLIKDVFFVGFAYGLALPINRQLSRAIPQRRP